MSDRDSFQDALAEISGAENPADGLLASCRAYLALFVGSDMRPEDECHELYTAMKGAVERATRPAPPKSNPPGWARPMISRKWHWFEAGKTISICGRYGYLADDREQGEDDSPDNCAACRKQKMAHDARNIKAKGNS